MDGGSFYYSHASCVPASSINVILLEVFVLQLVGQKVCVKLCGAFSHRFLLDLKWRTGSCGKV